MARGGPQPGSGRPKGKQNAATIELKDMIRTALDSAGGADYLAIQAFANPGAFMGLVGKILPKDVNVGGQADNPIKSEVSVAPPNMSVEEWLAKYRNVDSSTR